MWYKITSQEIISFWHNWLPGVYISSQVASSGQVVGTKWRKDQTKTLHSPASELPWVYHITVTYFSMPSSFYQTIEHARPSKFKLAIVLSCTHRIGVISKPKCTLSSRSSYVLDIQHRKYESQLIEVQFVIGVYIRFRKLLLNETPNTFLGQHWYQVQFDRNTTLKMDLYLGSRWHSHFVFFVPESDHCLALSVSHWLNDFIETQTKN